MPASCQAHARILTGRRARMQRATKLLFAWLTGSNERQAGKRQGLTGGLVVWYTVCGRTGERQTEGVDR
jgi:hypothetical protein